MFVQDKLDNLSIEDQAHADIISFANGSFEIYIRPYVKKIKPKGDEVLEWYVDNQL